MPLPDHETKMGGSREFFPETAWSCILSCPDPRSSTRQERLDRLCSLYWRPVYRFIRASWGVPIEDAKDLAQGFFCHILEGDFLSRYQAGKGRFRHFLKGALRNFLAEVHRDRSRLKRGGGKTAAALDVDDIEGEAASPDGHPHTPDELFDLQWGREVIARGVNSLRRQLQEEGKEVYFKVYEAYEISDTEARRTTYDRIARELNLSPHDVENYLSYARTRLQELILAMLTDHVTTREELMAEMRDLFFGR